MTARESWKTVGLALAALLFLAARPAHAQTSINFDNLVAGTAVSNQYPGVTFNGAGAAGAHISAGDVAAHSGLNVLINSPIANFNSGGPLTMKFSPAVQTVTLWAGFVAFAGAPPTIQGCVVAFDASGGLVPGAAVSGPVTPGMTNAPFTVSSMQGATIVSVTVDVGAGIYTVIDDLSFSGGSTTGAGPTVAITAPTDGATIDVTKGNLAVSGTVSSSQPLASNVLVTLQGQFFNAPGQTPPTVSIMLPLDSTQTSFSSSNAFSNLPVGIYKLTVTATDMAGESGSQTVTVNNLPPEMGLLPSWFQYSQVANAGECQFVAYNDTVANRALAFFPGNGNVIPVDVPVLVKWQQVNNPTILHADGTLGCPLPGAITAQETTPLAGTLANTYAYTIAPFERGSIYWVSSDKGAKTITPPTYTPKVFADAIAALSFYAPGVTPIPVNDSGGINEIGVPVQDPTFDLSVDDPTFLFQQFARPWYVARDSLGNPAETPGGHFTTPGNPNTLEIRGLIPTLYVERIGGSFLDYQAGFGFKNAGCQGVCNLPVPGDLTPTVWESAACTGVPGLQPFNCEGIDHPHVQAFTSQTNTPIYSTTSSVPDDTGYCAIGSSDFCEFLGADICIASGIALQLETEWSAIPNKSSPNTDTGDGDFPATHEHNQGSANGLIEFGTGVGCLVGSLGFLLPGPTGIFTTAGGCGLGAFISYQVGGMNNGIWSDWGIHVRPLALSDIADPNQFWVKTPAGLNLPPYWNLMASNGDPTLEGSSASPIGATEMVWEEFWQHSWVAAAGSTIPIGSLVFANGRWIIDCGHPPVHAEIHPPDTLMYSVSVTDPLNHSFANNTFTTAQMWVNEFYEGGSFQAQVWPPPRPTATAQMSVSLVDHGSPNGGPITKNNDGSVTVQATPSTNTFTQVPLPPGTPAITQANIVQRHNGLLITVEGPPTGHGLNDTGQDIYPDDHPDQAAGAISNLYGTWTVGWQCQNNCQ